MDSTITVTSFVTLPSSAAEAAKIATWNITLGATAPAVWVQLPNLNPMDAAKCAIHGRVKMIKTSSMKKSGKHAAWSQKTSLLDLSLDALVDWWIEIELKLIGFLH
jgi:hypothetical protein